VLLIQPSRTVRSDVPPQEPISLQFARFLPITRLGDPPPPASPIAEGARHVQRCFSVDDVKQAIAVAHAYRPLSHDERAELLKEGQRLAQARGLYYGPTTG